MAGRNGRANGNGRNGAAANLYVSCGPVAHGRMFRAIVTREGGGRLQCSSFARSRGEAVRKATEYALLWCARHGVAGTVLEGAME